VAFITGRNEGGRDFTAQNLQQQGFGSQCKKDAQGKVIRSSDEPCYVALHMRNLKGAHAVGSACRLKGCVPRHSDVCVPCNMRVHSLHMTLQVQASPL
jgi:hypothetical protein